ncbi:MAG: ECF transporter S component, partial [Lactobacillales bacterium]|nr:ECF transporter S component [Lactobacillales bacterium]
MSTKRFDAKHIALLSILVALNYVGRVVFQFLPNVQPMTAILLILTLYLGVWDGLIVATLSLILSNMILGMGPWTFAQLFSYAVI